MKNVELMMAGMLALALGVGCLTGCGGGDNGAPAPSPAPTATATPRTLGFQGLGVLTEHLSSRARAVSANGNAVVGSSTDSQGVAEAFHWTAAAGMIGLGNLPDRPNSEANAVSADGTVVGGTSAFLDLFDAFQWTMATGITKLAVTSTDPPPEAVTGISADGTVLVGLANFQYNDPVAFRWTAAGGLQQLGFLSGATGASVATSVSADGGVITGESTMSTTTVAFRWTSAGGMVALPLATGTVGAEGFAISPDGTVIVGSSAITLSPPIPFKASLWSSTGSAALLGDLPGGEQTSVARAVSQNGAVVVGQVNLISAFEHVAFIWDATHGMRPLQNVLTDAGLESELAGWTLENAGGISADGQVIVGSGQSPAGREEAFVATLP
ncbi:MAG: PEP-CTERM sorting domain-containing protein [Candidatus Binatia bacterium]